MDIIYISLWQYSIQIQFIDQIRQYVHLHGENMAFDFDALSADFIINL